MTDLDASQDPSPAASASPPRRLGIWRAISMATVVAALIVSALSILQSRDASNVAIPDRAPVLLEQVSVDVTDLPVPQDAEISVLGLADSESRRSYSASGTSIDVPTTAPALIALSDRDGAIVGLAISPPSESSRDVAISVQSTARALLFLSPGVLRPGYEATQANVAVIESDPAFEKLKEAIAANPNLSESNPVLEQAHAEIADRTPVQRPEPDQGCDSVFANNAYPSAGTCVQPKDTGLVISNEQDRWALIYSGTAGYTDLCATISPTKTEGAEVLIPSEQCIGESLLVAPGPVLNQGSEQPSIDERVRTAAAVTSLYNYAGPFAELAGGSAGFTDASVLHIRLNAADVVGSLSRLLETNPDFSEAMDVSGTASTALERYTSAVQAARVIIEAADTTALIPQRVAGDSGHIDLLDFYDRASERMISERTDWRWEADAVGMADFGTDS